MRGLAAFARSCPPLPPFESLEELVSHPEGFGLSTISPLQRACCRLIEGEPLRELAKHPHVEQFIGKVGQLRTPPAEVCIVSGIRVSKTMIVAGRAIRMALGAPLDWLKIGEIPRVSVVSLSKDQAGAAFGFVSGLCQSSPRLRPLLLEEPTADTVLLKHPSGRPVEIKIVAGTRAGGTLISRWSAGCIFDEAPRMVGAQDGVVNLDDARQSVIARMLPGCQIFYIGSPWAPFGPVWQMVEDHWLQPTAQMVVIRAPAWAMNPVTWTEERIAAVRLADPAAARTDIDAEFADPGAAMFTLAELRRVCRDQPAELPPLPGFHYEAFMDPATRGNAWTLVIVTRDVEDKRVVAVAREWVPGVDPLRPTAVLQEMTALLRRYGVTSVTTDQHAADAISDIGHGFKLTVIDVARTQALNRDMYSSLQTRIRADQIELAPVPRLLSDLHGVRKQTTPTGWRVVLPKTPDGRHCDFASALSLALYDEVRAAEDVSPRSMDQQMEEQFDAPEERDPLVLPVERMVPGYSDPGFT